MEIVIKIFLIVLMTIQFSCGPGNQTKEKGNEVPLAPSIVPGEAEEKPFANIHFASGYDTSCGMPLTAGIADTLHLYDKIYGFCSKECKDEFVSKLLAGKKR
jgi:hypothetical protein